MAQFLNAAQEAGIAAIALIPVFLLLNRLRFQNIKNTLLYLLFAVYLSGVYAVVGLPNVSYIRFEANLNFIPFAGMLSDLYGTVLNVILFIPLGLFLFLLWKPFRRISTVMLFGFSFSLAIEVLQMLTYRATDVSDLIANTLGTLAGYGIGRLVRKARPSLLLRCRHADLYWIIAVSSAVMFFIQPVIWNILY